MAIGARRFVQEQHGGVAVEFMALLPAFLFLTFFVFDIAIAVFWVGTVEKAAQLGARLAIVSNSAVTGLSQRNTVATGYLPGQHCRQNACVGFTSRTCMGGTGGDCNAGGFNTIFNRMDSIASMLEPANVSIRYEYVGLGFAGGPIIPRVTVTVQNVHYNTVTASILAGLMSLATGGTDFPGLTIMPPISASFTGEDLNSAGA